MSAVFPKPMAIEKQLKLDKSACKSDDLLQACGLLQKASSGTYYMAPDMSRCLEKLHKVIDTEMISISAQKVFLPCLSPRSLWEKSNRFEEMGSELIKVVDREGKDNCLSPTHEEAITTLLAHYNSSYKNLPIKWYQIGRKFRDEPRPKHGLLRCREFEMKDLYCFDQDEEHAQTSYAEVTGAYQRIFQRLGLDVERVSASSGAMGGTQSNEFHLVSDIGEDTLLKCSSCGHNYNKELLHDVKDSDSTFMCSNCDAMSAFERLNAIEISHSFMIGTKYSELFNAKYKSKSGKPAPYFMTCYGIGVTRLLAAAVEILSTGNELRWPRVLAPYQVFVIPQKKGHRFEDTFRLAEELAANFAQFSHLSNEIVLDDRCDSSIGVRVAQARCLGIPHIVTVGKPSLEVPVKYEYIDVYNDRSTNLSESELMGLFSVLDTAVLT